MIESKLHPTSMSWHRGESHIDNFHLRVPKQLKYRKTLKIKKKNYIDSKILL